MCSFDCISSVILEFRIFKAYGKPIKSKENVSYELDCLTFYDGIPPPFPSGSFKCFSSLC